jgi:hypothetical protein
MILARTQEPAPAPTLVIEPSGIHLAGGPVLVPGPADPARGADVAFKQRGPNDLYLVPLADALRREKAAGRARGSLRVLVDPSVGYRVLIEALYTGAQSGIGHYELCEKACTGRSIQWSLEAAGPGRAPTGRSVPSPPPDGLNVTVMVVDEGIGIKTAVGNVAPGCNDTGPGLTLPKVDAGHDLGGFAACLARIKSSRPEHATETAITFTASATTPFSAVMDVALASKGPSGKLFPEVHFGVSR